VEDAAMMLDEGDVIVVKQECFWFCPSNKNYHRKSDWSCANIFPANTTEVNETKNLLN
jgi:hypothetical protein